MLIIKHTVETSASPNQIWAVLQDVQNWKDWDHEIESCKLDGPFEPGTTGSLKLKDSPLLKTVLTHVEPPKMFVQEAKLPLAKVVMSHFINQAEGKTQVTFQTEIRGALAIVYTLLLGRSIKKKIPIEMAEMLKKAKALDS